MEENIMAVNAVIKRVSNSMNVPKNLCNKQTILRRVQSTVETEYSESYFNGNLDNSNYDQLELGEFHKLLDFLEEETASKFEMMRGLINEILRADHTIPVLLKGTNDRYYLVSGNEYMMAYKVLGIAPIVKVVKISKAI